MKRRSFLGMLALVLPATWLAKLFSKNNFQGVKFTELGVEPGAQFKAVPTWERLVPIEPATERVELITGGFIDVPRMAMDHELRKAWQPVEFDDIRVGDLIRKPVVNGAPSENALRFFRVEGRDQSGPLGGLLYLSTVVDFTGHNELPQETAQVRWVGYADPRKTRGYYTEISPNVGNVTDI